MSRSTMLAAMICLAGVSGLHARNVLQDAAPAPDFAPAPTGELNGVTGYKCPSPGSTGYLFQPAPCAYGEYEGDMIYCDEPTEGGGIVGIRGDDDGEEEFDESCMATADCDTGYFCNVHFNGTCTPVAPVVCFTGAPAPAPVPAPDAASS